MVLEKGADIELGILWGFQVYFSQHSPSFCSFSLIEYSDFTCENSNVIPKPDEIQ